MTNTYQITMATEADASAILSLYKAQIGREFCAWDEDYPSAQTIDFDLSRDALFVLKIEGQIKATISLEVDEAVDTLPCWDPSITPVGELARLAVSPEVQNQGLGRVMLQFGMDELARRGFRGIHILVNKHNLKAIRSYGVFGFRVAGECHMYEQDFLCYEKEF